MAPLVGEEAAKALNSLRLARDWVHDLSRLIPEDVAANLVNRWAHATTVPRFQSDVVKPFLDALMQATTDGVTWSSEGEALTNGKLFLSNHRDIVLDPSLVNVALLEHGREASEIGIGSNLLGSPWVSDLVRLNRCFVVERSGTPREKLHHSLRTAAYIQATVAAGHAVWLAHREGRSKDGMDQTAPALMRTLSSGGNAAVWDALKVVPVSISYEWDPCDALKVRELLLRERDGAYTKQPGEDEKSMWMGLVGKKGRVNLHFSDVFAWEADTDDRKPERGMAQRLDERLHTGMKVWPNQRLSAAWLGLDLAPSSAEAPTLEEVSHWESRMEAIVEVVRADGFSKEQVQRKWCEMVAGPLRSREALLRPGSGCLNK